MTNKTYQLETLSCPSCINKIEKMLQRTEGVTSGEVLFTSSKVKVTFDENVISSDEIKKKIETFGYKVLAER